MKKQNLILLIASVFWSLFCFSQSVNDRMLKMIPPTPEAYSMTRYGQYPVSQFTGIPSISVPLYDIEVGDLKIPIGISYHGGGHKVNDLASTIGLGWNLSAGGLISRVVMGVPDEHGNGIFYQGIKGNNEITPQYLDWVANQDKDSEQDIFSYSFLGVNGKFVFGKNREVHTIPYSDIKVNFENNIFTITDSQGRVFVFEERAMNSSFSENTSPKYFAPTSWYLTKVIMENKADIITFSYKRYNLGNIPTIDYGLSIGYLPSQPLGEEVVYVRNQASIPTKTVFYQNPNESFLDEVVFPNGKVKFKYKEERLDYGRAMLDSVIVTDQSKEIVKKISLDHEYFFSDRGYNSYATANDKYRLKLTAVKFHDIRSSSQFSKYKFEYEEGVSLPPRNNCGVDWWGYSNGSVSNEHLISLNDNGKEYEYNDGVHPKASSDIFRPANREPDENNMKASMLKRITYPTGGYTDFDFEANRVNVTYIEDSVNQSYMAVGDKESGQAQIINFTPTVNTSTATLRLNIPLWQDVKQPYVEFRNLTKGTFQRFVTYPGDPTFQTLTISLTAGNQYSLKANIMPNPSDPQDDTDERVLATISWSTGAQSVVKEQKGPGLRIKSIKSYTKENILTSFEEYKYGKDESGVGKSRFFDYILRKRTFVQKSRYVLESALTTMLPFEASTLEILSRPIYEYSSASYVIAYPEVVKYEFDSIGNNRKTVYKYSFEMDDQIEANIPDPQSLMSVSWKSGDLLSEEHYRRNSDGSYNLIDEQINKYNTVNIDTDYGLKVSRKVIKRGKYIDPPKFDDFYYFEYPISSGINKLISTENNNYTETEMVNEWRKFTYLTDKNLRPRITHHGKSDGSSESFFTSYANDYLVGTPFIDDMNMNNLLSYPIEEVRYKEIGGNVFVVSGKIYKYLTGGKGLLDQILELESAVPLALSEFKFSNKTKGVLPTAGISSGYLPAVFYKPSIEYGNNYTINGRPLLMKPQDGPPTSILWDYNKQNVAATVRNATPNNVAYTSFETEDTGNWELTGGSYTSSVALTGNKGYILPSAGKIYKAGLNSMISYIISYWSRNSSLIVNGEVGILKDSKNGWKKYEHLIKGSSSVSISGNATIDELGLLPLGAEMITYTYKPLVGITSRTDARGVTEYYQYDGMQRLQAILDQLNNVTKAIDYHYRPN
ncbi:hypothetical protein [Sphingobacterium thalpophilum]|uniref:hypothetical protein n=1 Tax=Sphingobacterium thalpophilum TaxID=259 RepID=UPI002D79D451|nr:hypothetical protein [Sphingobacterium thalpophilum]